LDGVILFPSDYSVSGGNLTLTTGASAGQKLIVQYLWAGSYLLATPLSFTAATGQTAFDLSAAPANAEILYVTLDGVVQNAPSKYSVAGTTLTLVTGANAGQVLFVQYVASATSSNVGSFLFGPYPDANYII